MDKSSAKYKYEPKLLKKNYKIKLVILLIIVL